MFTDRLTQWVAAHHMASVGMEAKPEYKDFVSAFQRDPSLYQFAQDELYRLNLLNSSFGGQLKNRDHDQGVRLSSLKKMLATFEEATKHATRESGAGGSSPGPTASGPTEQAAGNSVGGATGADRPVS